MPSWRAVPESVRARFPPPPERDSYSSQKDYEEARGYWQGHVGRSIGLAMQLHREQPRPLWYRVVPHNGGIVFAEPDRAAHIARIHSAISDALTWGDFRRKMPAEEFAEILHASFDELEEPRPADDDVFTGESLSGWVDGNYPPWLQKELESVLPSRVLYHFAKRLETPVSGSYWHIPEDSESDICTVLADLGFQLECKNALSFH